MNNKWKHGGNVYEIEKQYGIEHQKIIDFSANINPLGFPKGLKEAIVEGLEDLVHYPDPNYEALIEAIARYNQMNSEWVYPGNGAIELIYLIVEYLKPAKAHVIAPGFVEYERSLKRYGAEINWIVLKEENDFQLTWEEISSCMNKPEEPLILASPNNPTGALIEPELLNKIIEEAEKNAQPVIMDEAFIDFVEDSKHYSLSGEVQNHPYLFILRSMTKCYAIPGLRLGYLLTSHPGFRAWMEEYRIPWMINHLAVRAGIVSLKECEHLEKTRQYVKMQKGTLVEGLRSVKGIKVYPAEANFISFKLCEGQIDLRAELLKKGIMIRSCANYIGLDSSYYRIAVKTAEENQILLAALKEILS